MDPWYLRVEWLRLGLGAGALGMGATPVFLILRVVSWQLVANWLAAFPHDPSSQ
jgi:hypothetical protein